jgi:hypothetical protein
VGRLKLQKRLRIERENDIAKLGIVALFLLFILTGFCN